MAEAPVTTKAPPTPTAPNLPSNTVPLNSAFANEPIYVEAMAKNNHALSTTLANDNLVMGDKLGAYNYNNTLLEGTNASQPGSEARGFQALESRDLTGNSGIALRGREALAERFQNVKNRNAFKLTQELGKLGLSAQQAREGAEQNATSLSAEAQRRRAAAIAKTPNEAPPGGVAAANAAAATPGMGGVQGYPKATAYVGSAFPGGQAEQVAFGKMNPQQKQVWERQHGFRAQGGPVTPGNAYIVGEQGPEIMVPRTGGKIIPNARGAAMRRAAARGRR